MRAPRLGDLAEIRERGVLRVLVSPSPHNFFLREGRALGFEAEAMREMVTALDRGRDPDERLDVVFVPRPFDQLLPDLLAGRGDVVASGLAITPARAARVSFAEPYLDGIEEVIVAHRDVQDLRRPVDLAGRTVRVVRGSSWVESLEQFSDALEVAGAEPIRIVEADPFLEIHDLLELVDTGVVPLTVADRHVAELWSDVLPNLVVRDDLVLASDRSLAWAVRPGSPHLRDALSFFARRFEAGTLLGNLLFERYYRRASRLRDVTLGPGGPRLARLEPIFRRYAERHDLDWRLLAAVAVQESGLDPRVVSHAGAVGLMQLRPTTARAMGVDDPRNPEGSVRAAARYLARLRDVHFDDPTLDDAARLHFALASYNAGPTRVQALRRRAAEKGLDPDHWFDHVEVVARRAIGRETVEYVTRVRQLYVAFRLAEETERRRRAVRERLDVAVGA